MRAVYHAVESPYALGLTGALAGIALFLGDFAVYSYDCGDDKVR